MGLLGSGPDLMAEIGLDARGFLLGARQVDTSLNYLMRHPLFTAGAIGTALGVTAVNAAAKFEDSMLAVAATMDLTEQETREFAKSILALSSTKPFGADEIASVVAVGGQLGIAKENVLDFTTVMLDMGRVSNMSATDAADAFARLANAGGVPQDQFDEMANTVRFLGRNLAATESEIVRMSFRIAGAGSLAGLSTDQILGLAGALSSLGIRAEMGGSAASKIIKAMHNSVNSETDEARERLELFAQVAGTSAENFARVWESAPQAALLQFLQGLSDLEEAGDNVIDTLGALGLGEIRVSDVTLRAKNGQELLRRSLMLAKQGWAENNALTIEAARRYEATVSQLRLLGNDIRGVAIAFGSDMLPAVNRAIGGLREFIATGGGLARPIGDALIRLKNTTLDELAAITSAFLVAFSAGGENNVTVLVNAAAGAIDALRVAVDFLAAPFVVVARVAGQLLAWATDSPDHLLLAAAAVGTLGTMAVAAQFGLYGGAVSAGVFSAAMGVAAAATWLANAPLALFNILINPITGTIAIIAATIMALVLVWRYWDEVVAAFNVTVEWLSEALGAAWDWMRRVADAVGGVLVVAWNSLVEATAATVDALRASWQGFKDFVVGAFDSVREAVGGAWAFIRDAFQTGVDFGKAIWDGYWNTLGAPLVGAWEAVKTTVAAGLLAVVGLFTNDTDLIKRVWTAWADEIVGIGASVWDRVKAPFENIVSTIRDFGATAFDKMREGFEAGWASVTDWFSGLGASLAGFLAGLPGSIYNIGVRFIESIKDGGVAAWTAVGEWVTGRVSAIADALSTLPQTLYDLAYDAVRKIRTGAVDVWSIVRSWFEDLPSRVVTAIGDVASTVKAVGTSVVEGIKTGISDAWDAFKNWLRSKMGDIVAWAKEVLGIRSPSTVFADIGQNVVAGFARGIEPLGDLLAGGRIEVAPLTMNGGGGVGVARGGVSIGSLTIHASGRREGDEASRAFMRRLERLGVSG